MALLAKKRSALNSSFPDLTSRSQFHLDCDLFAMSLNIFSSLRSATNAVPSACRWSSTAAMSAFTSQRSPSTFSKRLPRFFEACNSLKKFADHLTPESNSNQRMHPNYRKRFLEDQKSQGESKAMEKFQSREWKAGDIYAPHDLSPAEMKKWSKRKAPSFDAFDALNLNPLDLHKVRTLDPQPSTSVLRSFP